MATWNLYVNLTMAGMILRGSEPSSFTFLLPFSDVLCLTSTVISGRLPARPITRTGRLLHTAKKKVNRLPALVDNPHVVIQLFGGVTLR